MQTMMHTQTGLYAFHPQTLFKTPVWLGVSFYNRSFFPGCFFMQTDGEKIQKTEDGAR